MVPIYLLQLDRTFRIKNPGCADHKRCCRGVVGVQSRPHALIFPPA